LVRILTEGRARRGFELLDESGLLEHVLPEVAHMKGVAQPPQYHPEGDVWVHTLMLLDQLDAAVSPTLALGALLHDVGKPPTFRVAERIRFDGHAEVGALMAGKIMERLRFSRDETERVRGMVADHMRFMNVQQMKDSTLKRFLRLPWIDELLELHRMDCLAGSGDLHNYEFVRRKLEEFSHEALRPTPLLTGADLIAEGFNPGPQFKRILSEVEELQLNGELRTRDEAIRWLRESHARQ